MRSSLSPSFSSWEVMRQQVQLWASSSIISQLIQTVCNSWLRRLIQTFPSMWVNCEQLVWRKFKAELKEQYFVFWISQMPVTYDALMKMDYLEMAINESMRLLPTAPRLERTCKKTVELNGVTIPQDTLVGIPTYVLNRDPQLWESPDEFRPERWCVSSSKQKKYMTQKATQFNCISITLI